MGVVERGDQERCCHEAWGHRHMTRTQELTQLSARHEEPLKDAKCQIAYGNTPAYRKNNIRKSTEFRHEELPKEKSVAKAYHPK